MRVQYYGNEPGILTIFVNVIFAKENEETKRDNELVKYIIILSTSLIIILRGGL